MKRSGSYRIGEDGTAHLVSPPTRDPASRSETPVEPKKKPAAKRSVKRKESR